MKHTATIERKPDGKSTMAAPGETPENTVEVSREWLATISDSHGTEVDAAYFPTKKAAEEWAANTYHA